MSLRRQSCDSCFQARRKCDLSYPACSRCRNRNTPCTYAYPPRQQLLRSNVDPSTIVGPIREVPRGFVGPPDQVPRVQAPDGTGLAWICDLLHNLPLTFAEQGETVFINKALFHTSTRGIPEPLLSAFCICAACASLNEQNRPLLFQAIDARMTDLLRSIASTTSSGDSALESLRQDLAELQAVVLYQIIRLFHGGVEQRIVSERQEYLIRAHALRLLRQADAGAESASTNGQDWESWVVHESIRRTVFIAFKLYTVHRAFRYGWCAEIAALDMLPVSLVPAKTWYKKSLHLPLGWHNSTTTASDFAAGWTVTSRPDLDPFERVVLFATCKGADGQPASRCSEWVPVPGRVSQLG